MGFDPFNTFGTTFDQAMIVSIVKAMARNGMRAAGYRYVILDDGWQGPRNAEGHITADPHRFPCGIRRLAEFVHKRGFLLGLYATPGPRSCAGRTGDAGHTAADARTFASWGVDYIKLDWCYADYAPSAAAAITRQWRAAVDATRRPMILSINAGGSPTVARWAHTLANSWRVGGDICGSWYNQTRPASPTARRCYHDRRYHMGIFDYLTSSVLRKAARYAGPGHHLDPDMLEVGTAAERAVGPNLAADALTFSEAETNFSMWAMWSAPLIAGNDPRAMKRGDAASRILLNHEIIAIDQNPLGRPAALVPCRCGWQVWNKVLSARRSAVAIVNLADRPASAAFTWAQLGLTGQPARIRNLWTHRRVPVTTTLGLRLPAHATAVYLITGG
jgi:alpha-galactosidase